MKHNLKLSLILIGLFFLSQLIGLFVSGYYLENSLPYNFDKTKSVSENPAGFLINFVISFIFAMLLISLLMKMKYNWILKLWFFVVIAIALSITINSFIGFSIKGSTIISLIMGAVFSVIKLYFKNTFIHNLIEVFIYPGIAIILSSLINIPLLIILLILVSIYDIWAVWHSGIMQKMAHYQINSLKLFSGLFIPYAGKKIKEKIKLLNLKYKNNIPYKILKKEKIKINVAMLGGGDIFFSIVASGVVLKLSSSIYPSLIICLTSTIALAILLFLSKKKKYYPAMPFISAGIFLGMIVNWILF
jgi:presenilin-like A22 family membrane protease